MQSRLVFRRDRVILNNEPNGMIGPLNGIVFHFVSSQTKDVDCLVDSSNISRNTPTILCPDLISTMCEILRTCQCKWLFVSSSGSPGKFLFCTCRVVSTVLPNLVPQRRIDDCCVTHFLLWELCDPQLLYHQHFPVWVRQYQHVFCTRTLLFSSSSRYRNSDPSASACGHYAYSPPRRHIDDCSAIHSLYWEFCDLLLSSHQNVPLGTTVPARLLQEAFDIFVFMEISQLGSFGKCENTLWLPEPGSTFARDSIGNSWDELEVSRCLGAGFPRGSEGLRSSTKCFLNSCSSDFFVSSIFICVFGFWRSVQRVSP